jgi:hypothetical protein
MARFSEIAKTVANRRGAKGASVFGGNGFDPNGTGEAGQSQQAGANFFTGNSPSLP